MGPAPRRRADPHRRSPHARQLALLARGSIQAGQQSAVLRQAVRPRLAGDHRVGQKQPPADAARRSGDHDAAEGLGGLRTADGSAASRSLGAWETYVEFEPIPAAMLAARESTVEANRNRLAGYDRSLLDDALTGKSFRYYLLL